MSVHRASPVLLVLLATLGAAFPASSTHLGGDCDLGGDVDSFGLTWTVPFTCEGWVTGDWNGDRTDQFRVNATERVTLGFTLHNEGPDTLFVDLLSPDGERISHTNVRAGMTDAVVGVTDELGLWVLQVRGFSPEPEGATYQASGWSETAPPPVPPQDDCGSGRDTGSGYFNASPEPIPNGVECVGAFADYGHATGYGHDELDGYWLHLARGHRLTVTVDAPASVADLLICPWYDACVHRADPASGPLTMVLTAQEGHDRLFTIEGWVPPGAGQVTYVMNVTDTPPVLQTQTETGMLRAPGGYGYLYPNPGEDFVPGVPLEGVSYFWMKLEEPAAEDATFVVRGKNAEPLFAVFNAAFYEETPHGLQNVFPQCVDAPNEHRCTFGAVRGRGATWVRVDLVFGVEVPYEATYTYWLPTE